jgi:hypothetical protein
LIWGLFFQFCIHGPFDLTKVCKNASQQEFFRYYKNEVHRFKKITFQVNFTGSTTNFGFTWNFLWNRSGFCSLYIYNMWVLLVSFKISALNKNLVRYISNKLYMYIYHGAWNWWSTFGSSLLRLIDDVLHPTSSS